MIEDKDMETSRPVIETQLLFSGNNIEMTEKKEDEARVYSVSFTKNIFMEKDLTKNCKNYPNKNFQTYNDCDAAFIHNFYNSIGQLNPIWVQDLSRNISSSTFIPNLTKDNAQVSNVVTGVTSSKCPLPCSTTRVSSRLLSAYSTGSAYNWIDLVPVSSVLVTTTDFVKPNLSKLLSEYGGSMGLWLGLGVVQLFQICFFIIKQYTCIKKKVDK